MSGAAKSPDADDDLVRVRQAMEPSMEEILASIRGLIADDTASETLVTGTPLPPRVSVSIEPVEIDPEPAVSAPQAAPEVTTPRVVWSRPAEPAPTPVARATPEPISAPVPAIAADPPALSQGERLLSADADQAAASSFAALNTAIELRSSDIAERMVGELLRPMLKNWLDENLPSIVERLVRAEIQRVARGRG